MTYLELFREAERQRRRGNITIQEYSDMIAPLRQEIKEDPMETGKWINNTCNLCNTKALLKRHYDMDGTSLEYELSPHCPKCGAKMKQGGTE